jgi:crossover junction endodeoxyribonuclease RuvC
MARILGIDPGSRIIGFAVVETNLTATNSTTSYSMANKTEVQKSNSNKIKYVTHGVIQLDTKTDLVYRLREIGEAIVELLHRYTPTELAIENVFMGKNADSAFKLGQARGVIIYECVKQGMAVGQYAPREVKKGVTGSGTSEKEDLIFVLEKALECQLEKNKIPMDATDALAIAFHHAAQIQSHSLTSGLLALY